jgi:hypothetical protein
VALVVLVPKRFITTGQHHFHASLLVQAPSGP